MGRRALSLVLAAAALSVVLGATPLSAAAPECDIVGTPGDDVLVGTAASETICGLGGHDVIRGARGNDVLIGGDGNDVLIGGPGHDLLLGGAGDDRLDGRSGRDRLFGQEGDDALDGANGRDRLVGGDGVDSCVDGRGRTRARSCEIGVGGAPEAWYVAHARWTALEVDEFVYVLGETPGCLATDPPCSVPVALPVVVHVRDGVAATPGDGADGVSALSAGDLFAAARVAEEQGGHVLYDDVLGLPRSIVGADGDALVVGEIELRDDLRAAVAEARARWAQAALDDYAYTVRRICSCPGPHEVRVTVSGGEVVDSVPLDDPASPLVPDGQLVEWHFDHLIALLDGHNGSVHAEFDTRFGFPTSYGVDVSPFVADEDRTVEIVDFEDPNALQVVEVGGIWVNSLIADQVHDLLAAAALDGHELAGGGYRDPARQIELRRAHCGTSDYAIWEMPAAQCSPPTARPGRSMHEQGLAIDFTASGRLIRSREEPAFLWLVAHAESFGFANHPAEPWHWSVNGN